MHALVVVADPEPGSLCHAAAARAVAGLERAGHHVDVIDLYQDGFRAAMSYDERLAYEGDRPILDPQVAAHAALVRRAGILVFVYPTWWSGLPAIARGWLERTLVPGVAFHLDPVTKRVRPGLAHVRRVVGITTWIEPRRHTWLVHDNGRRVLTRALRLSCGWRTRTTWLACYDVEQASPDRHRSFLDRIERTLARC